MTDMEKGRARLIAGLSHLIAGVDFKPVTGQQRDLEATSKLARRKRRSPSLASALKQAAKAGAPVSATIEDGKVTLTFGEAATAPDNPWDRAIADLAKGGKTQ